MCEDAGPWFGRTVGIQSNDYAGLLPIDPPAWCPKTNEMDSLEESEDV